MDEARHANKEDIIDYLELLESMYWLDGNPLAAWEAYAISDSADLPLPYWAATYFRWVSTHITSLIRDVSRGNDIGNHDQAILYALRLKKNRKGGRGTIFTEYNKTKPMLYGLTAKKYISEGDKEYIAIEKSASEHGVSESTVRRALRMVNLIMPDMFTNSGS